MSQLTPFQQLLNRLRVGDNSAAGQLYVEYAPHLRLVIKRRLVQRGLQWATEPDDVLDSVFRTLFCHGSLSPVENEQHLVQLLEQAVDRYTLRVLRKLTAGCRDFRRESHDLVVTAPPSHNPCEDGDLLGTAWDSLSAKERLICTLHRADYSWDEIGERLAMTAAAARKAFQRTEARVRERYCRA
jgi:DNA-directed RNA polymerase specialized sigma24 family protein